MQATCNFEFEQNGQKHRGSQMALAQQFVNRHRCWTQGNGHAVTRFVEFLVSWNRSFCNRENR